MSEWREDDGQLVLDLKFGNFAEAMAFVNKVADAAEEAVDLAGGVVLEETRLVDDGRKSMWRAMGVARRVLRALVSQTTKTRTPHAIGNRVHQARVRRGDRLPGDRRRDG